MNKPIMNICFLELLQLGETTLAAECSPSPSAERTACVLPVKSVTDFFVTLISKSESICRLEDAGSRLRCALEAVRGSLQNILTLLPPFCP